MGIRKALANIHIFGVVYFSAEKLLPLGAKRLREDPKDAHIRSLKMGNANAGGLRSLLDVLP